MTDEKALLAAEKAYREHIEGRPMVHAIQAYLTSSRPAMGDDVVERVADAIGGNLAGKFEAHGNISLQKQLIGAAKAALAAIPAGAPAPADEAHHISRNGDIFYCSTCLSSKECPVINATLNQQKGEK